MHLLNLPYMPRVHPLLRLLLILLKITLSLLRQFLLPGRYDGHLPHKCRDPQLVGWLWPHPGLGLGSFCLLQMGADLPGAFDQVVHVLGNRGCFGLLLVLHLLLQFSLGLFFPQLG